MDLRRTEIYITCVLSSSLRKAVYVFATSYIPKLQHDDVELHVPDVP
jgi:hypothetical protein